MSERTPQERLRDLVEQHRTSLSHHCDCGEEGCPGTTRPALSDPRVISATLGSVLLELRTRPDEGLLDAACEFARMAHAPEEELLAEILSA